MKARLFCRYGKMKGASFEIDREVTLGRGDSNSIVLPPKAISSHHAKILYDADLGGYVLEDLGSLNGTELDGAAVSSPRRLDRLHLITFGGSLDFIFQNLDAFPNASPWAPSKGSSPNEGTQAGTDPPELPSILAPERPGAAPLERPEGGTLIDREGVVLPPNLANHPLGSEPREVAAASTSGATGSEARVPSPEGTLSDFELPSLPRQLQVSGSGEPTSPPPTQPQPSQSQPSQAQPEPSPPSFWLELTSPVGEPRRFPLVEGENVVGRGEGAEVILEGPDISRRHAVITLRGEAIWLRDEGSSNHSYVGGERLSGEASLEVGARIRFGSLEARLRSSLLPFDREDPA